MASELPPAEPAPLPDDPDTRIAELERELAMLQERLWLQDGCGDSSWDV
jgi:hypothetical protein